MSAQSVDLSSEDIFVGGGVGGLRRRLLFSARQHASENRRMRSALSYLRLLLIPHHRPSLPRRKPYSLCCWQCCFYLVSRSALVSMKFFVRTLICSQVSVGTRRSGSPVSAGDTSCRVGSPCARHCRWQRHKRRQSSAHNSFHGPSVIAGTIDATSLSRSCFESDAARWASTASPQSFWSGTALWSKSRGIRLR